MAVNFFYMAVFLIPFDNLVIAPSAGWAAISPLLFFLSLGMLKYEKRELLMFQKRNVNIVLSVIVVTGSYFIFYQPYINLLVTSFASLVLGFTFYLSMKAFVVYGSVSYTKFIRLLGWGYLASIAYGVVNYLFHEIGFGVGVSFFEIIEKRYYFARYSLSYTEPSFASMHVFGVLLPIVLLSFVALNKKLITQVDFYFIVKVFFLQVLTCLMIVDSVRFKVDTLVVFAVMTLFLLYSKKIKIKLLFFVGLISAISLLILTFNYIDPYSRLGGIIHSDNLLMALNVDASLSSRFFRVVALYDGLIAEPFNALFGYGLSNAHIPFNLGYNFAYGLHENSFDVEILKLGEAVDDQYFNMHLRVIAEYGLIIWAGAIFLLFNRYLVPVYLLILYLYLQFDSYAFYSLWLYLILLLVFKKHCPNGYKGFSIKRE